MTSSKEKRVVINNDAHILIVSDLHLPQSPTESSRERVNKLVDLLSEKSEDATHIVLLGDVFDFWFEYPHVVPRGHFNLLRPLCRFADAGKKVIFFPGNHDYWIGDFFRDELGLFVAAEQEVWVLGDRVIALTHGDGCDPDDRGYHLLKRILRARLSIWGFRLVHPEFAFAVARFVSNLSRRAAERKKTWYNSRFMPYAKEQFNRGVDTVIVGHSHTPQLIKTAKGLLVNTGDWLMHHTYGFITADSTKVISAITGDSLPVQTPDDFLNPPLGAGRKPS